MPVPQQSLPAAQIAIAGQFDLNLADLRRYMTEDTIGGYHSDERQSKWPVGSLWSVEGALLYALTRIIQPELVIEIGTHLGCSTTHFAAALKANGKGKVISIDTAKSIDLHGTGIYAVGELIQDDLRDYVELVNADGVAFVQNALGYGAAAIIYEDADHSSETTRAVWTAGSGKLAAGGFLISHDACHFLVGEDIWLGVMQSGTQNPHRHLIEPSDCGVALWRAEKDRQFAPRLLAEEAKVKPKPRNAESQAFVDAGWEYEETELTVSEQLDAAFDEGETEAARIREEWLSSQYDDEYDSLTKNELADELAERKIPYNFKDKKYVLIDLLRKDDALEI